MDLYTNPSLLDVTGTVAALPMLRVEAAVRRHAVADGQFGNHLYATSSGDGKSTYPAYIA